MWVGRPRARRRRTGGPVSTVPSHLPLSCTRRKETSGLGCAATITVGPLFTANGAACLALGGPRVPLLEPLLAIGRVPERRGLGAPPFRFVCCSPAARLLPTRKRDHTSSPTDTTTTHTTTHGDAYLQPSARVACPFACDLLLLLRPLPPPPVVSVVTARLGGVAVS